MLADQLFVLYLASYVAMDWTVANGWLGCAVLVCTCHEQVPARLGTYNIRVLENATE